MLEYSPTSPLENSPGDLPRWVAVSENLVTTLHTGCWIWTTEYLLGAS